MSAAFNDSFACPADWGRMYRSLGIQIVPCYMPSERQNWKRPALADWVTLQHSFIPEAAFERWYGPRGEHFRRTNMGILTGACSGGKWVLDLDDHKTPQAAMWWRGVLEANNAGIEPFTWQQRTGGGGRQIVFASPAGWSPPTNKTPIGVDIRGQGGFAVLPPSLHDSKKHYEWLPNQAPWETPIVEAPLWLCQAIDQLVAQHGGGSEHKREKTYTSGQDGDFNAFGQRQDGREDYMTRLIWATLIDLHKECPIPPTSNEIENAYQIYERSTKSRLYDQNATKRELLEREDRGYTLFAKKWRKAMEKWGDEIANEAHNEKSHNENDGFSERGENSSVIKCVDFHTLMTEDVTEEPDYMEPDLAGPDGFVLIAGPPKAQKSFLLQEMLVAAATGGKFLEGLFCAPRPLRVFWLQAEMGRKLLRKRARVFQLLTPKEKSLLKTNLIVSERFTMILNDDGVQEAIKAIKKEFPNDPPDIIGIDPLANVFDQDNESDNAQVMRFLRGRIEAVRKAVNPLACVVMVHHSAKRSQEDLARDPFTAIRGASALRGYYDSAIIIFKRDEETRIRKIFFELRSGDSPEPREVELLNGRFVVANEMKSVNVDAARAMLADIGAAWDAGKPLSVYPQTRNEGRYAPRELSRKFRISAEVVSHFIQEWLSNGIIAIEISDKRQKMKGIKVIGSI